MHAYNLLLNDLAKFVQAVHAEGEKQMRKALILYTRAEFLSWCRTLGGGGSHRNLSSYYERGSHIHCLLSSDHALTHGLTL